MVQTPAHRPASTPARASGKNAGEDATLQWRPGRLLAAIAVLVLLFIGASFVIR